jgi:glycosyltransferase involved in cell wall biosynthesis
MAAVGGQRIVYFCKYLRRFGWEPVVLTVKSGVNISWDPSLLEKVKETRVYRSITFEPVLRRELSQSGSRPSYRPGESSAEIPSSASLLRRLKRWFKWVLTVPDHAIFWVPFGVLKGLGAIRKEKPQVIFSSSPPVSSHLVASILSRLGGIPHVVDFRDLWTLNHLYEQRGYPRVIRAYDRFWERFVLKKAAAVVTASPGFTRQMEEHIAGLYNYPVETITNGFDYEEGQFQGPRREPGSDKLRFLYIGSLYADFNPVFFFEGLAQWVRDSGIDRSSVQVDFYGNCSEDYTEWLEKLGLNEVVTFHGFKSRSELLPLLLEVECLLLFLGFNDQVRNVIPAKLFEYLASGAAILAVVPKGVTSELIEQNRAGYCICRPDQPALATALQEIYEAQKHAMLRTEFRYIKDIDRVHLAERLAGLFDRVTQSRKS